MVRKISDGDRSNIIERHLQGMSRDAIAGALHISGSTASGAWGKFLAAARTYGVEREVVELRDLAVILRKERISPAESKDGAVLLGLIRGMGAEDGEELKQFVAGLYKACVELHYDPKGVVRHMAAVDGLVAMENKLMASISDLKAKRAAADEELLRLSAQLNAKRFLADKISEVEGMGLNAGDLETIRGTVAAIATKHRLAARGSMRKLLAELKNQYDSVLGFENLLGVLQAKVEMAKLDVQTVNSALKNLAAKYRARTSAIDAMEALAGKGISDEQIVYLNSLLTKTKAGVDEFGEGLKKYDDLRGLIAAKEREVELLREEVDQLADEVKGLKAEKSRLEGWVNDHLESIDAKVREVDRKLGQYRSLEPFLKLFSSREGDPPMVFAQMHQLCLAFNEWLVGKPLKGKNLP